MRQISFTVPGIPAPGGSKKAFIPKGWSRAIITDAAGEKNREWKAAVAFAAYEAMKSQGETTLFSGPMEMEVIFYMPRTKAHFNSKGELRGDAPLHHTNRPDVSKTTRSTEDAMTGVVWEDDSEVVQITARKLYGSPTGALIRVNCLSQ